MADEILNCDGTDPIHIPDWDNVIGDATLNNGGYIGDILTLSRAHIEEAKANGELTEEDAGKAYSTAIIQSVSEAIKFELQEGKSKLEMCFLQAQIDKIHNDIINDTCLATAECALKAAQQAEIEYRTANILPLEVDKLVEEIDLLESKDIEQIASTIREDCKAESQCALNTQQIEKSICDCTNDTNMTDSKISLNAAQENELACKCCNDSKRTEGQIVKWECDCHNSGLVSSAQSELYTRQKEGFNDNANQKIYDTQMSAWSMVFADADLDFVEPSISEDSIDLSYQRIQDRLTAGAEQSAQEDEGIPGVPLG